MVVFKRHYKQQLQLLHSKIKNISLTKSKGENIDPWSWGAIFSQHGPKRAWLIRGLLHDGSEKVFRSKKYSFMLFYKPAEVRNGFQTFHACQVSCFSFVSHCKWTHLALDHSGHYPVQYIHLVNQARGPYWKNISTRSWQYGPSAVRSAQKRRTADILPVRSGASEVNKGFIKILKKIFTDGGGQRKALRMNGILTEVVRGITLRST